MEKYRSDKKVIILLLLPALLIYISLAVIPIIQSIYFAFFEWPGIQGIPLKYVGLRNFSRLIDYSGFHLALKNVMRFVILNLLIQMPIGYGLAILVSSRFRGFKLYKMAYFFPVVLPLTAVSLLWVFIYFPNNTGALNLLLNSIGLTGMTRAWLLDPRTALNSVIVANAWTGLGYHMIIGFAAISAIPEEIIESARLDGATGLKKIRYIVIPTIWEAIRISVILIVIGSMKNFDIIFVMTEGGPNGLTHVPATLLYYEAFRYENYGLGSAISMFIFVASVALSVLSMQLMKKEKIEY